MLDMKKNLFVGILFISIAFFLAGCITIPFGNDKVIEISSSGMEVLDNIKDIVHDESSQESTDMPRGGGVVSVPNTEEPKKENEIEKVDDQPDLIPEEEEEDDNTPFAYDPPEEEAIKYVGEPEEDTECNFDYTEFTDHLPVEIYIPYCAILLGVVDFGNGASAGFLVDLVFYDDILHNYKTYLGLSRDEYFDSDKGERYEVGRGILVSGNLRGGGKLY